MASCQPSVQKGVSGTLEGVESDSLLTMCFELGSGKNPVSDTIVLKNNKFSFSVNDSALQIVRLYPIPTKGMAMDMSKVISLPVLPGVGVQITGKLGDYKLSGDPFYDELMKVDALRKPYMAKMDSLLTMARKMQKDGAAQEEIMEAYKPAQGYFEEMNQLVVDYIAQHGESAVSLYLLSQMDRGIQIDQFGKISENLKNGVWAPLYNTMKQGYDQEMARRKAAEKVQDGCPAPDFTLNDLNGKAVSLSSLQGKYVVLDFWGSWCGWCIKGMPKMKEYYAKYHKKLEIMGIACNDSEKTWRKAVETHKLPWLNVLNDPAQKVLETYAISGFPTKLVIGKDGKILKTFVGEDPAFYTFLDSILK